MNPCPPRQPFRPVPRQLYDERLDIPLYCSPADYAAGTPVTTIRGRYRGPPQLIWTEAEIPE